MKYNYSFFYDYQHRTWIGDIYVKDEKSFGYEFEIKEGKLVIVEENGTNKVKKALEYFSDQMETFMKEITAFNQGVVFSDIELIKETDQGRNRYAFHCKMGHLFFDVVYGNGQWAFKLLLPEINGDGRTAVYDAYFYFNKECKELLYQAIKRQSKYRLRLITRSV